MIDLSKIKTVFSRQDKDKEIAYSVLLPLIEKDGKLFVLFEVRNPDIPQGGEVCFPGGMIEGEESDLEAAIRETCEELLIRPEQIEILAPLKKMTAIRSRKISAFIGLLKDYEMTYSKEETESIFLLSIDELLEMKPISSTISLKPEFPEDFPFALVPGGRNYPFRYGKDTIWFYETSPVVIWGLTGDLLHDFLEHLREQQ